MKTMPRFHVIKRQQTSTQGFRSSAHFFWFPHRPNESSTKKWIRNALSFLIDDPSFAALCPHADSQSLLHKLLPIILASLCNFGAPSFLTSKLHLFCWSTPLFHADKPSPRKCGFTYSNVFFLWDPVLSIFCMDHNSGMVLPLKSLLRRWSCPHANNPIVLTDPEPPKIPVFPGNIHMCPFFLSQ